MRLMLTVFSLLSPMLLCLPTVQMKSCSRKGLYLAISKLTEADHGVKAGNAASQSKREEPDPVRRPVSVTQSMIITYASCLQRHCHCKVSFSYTFLIGSWLNCSPFFTDVWSITIFSTIISGLNSP